VSSRRGALVVLVAAAVTALAFQGTRGLYETTESRYAEVSREMLETGNWLVPQLDYQPHWSKPPLDYWAVAGSMAVLGVNEWGARLPDAVAFVLTAWLVMALGTVLWDRRTGILAGLIYATAPFTAGAANTINTDTLLTLWMLLVVFSYWRARQAVAGGGSGRAWILLLWTSAALAFLTKGPPSLLVLLVIALCHVIDRRQGRPVPRLLSLWGILAFLLIGLGWYAWAAVTHPGLIHYWLADEVAGRIGSAEFGRNPEWYKPVTIYFVPLAIGLGLWSFVAAVPMFRHARSLSRTGILSGLRERPVLRFLLTWIAVPLIILSVARSRLPLYVLPLFPALALVTARSLMAAWPARRVSRVALVVGIASLVLVVGGKAVLAYMPSARDERRLYQSLRVHLGSTGWTVNCTNRELHGVTFYLGGRAERVDLVGTEQEIADRIRSVAAMANTRRRVQPGAIITRQKDLRIPHALDDLGVAYERVVMPQGAVILVGST